MKHTDHREALALGRNESHRHDANEIDAVVSLLRSLPDPEPSADLTARIMRRVSDLEARPRVLRPFFGWPSASNVAAVLAAGIACATVGIRLQVPVAMTVAPTQVDVATTRAGDARALGIGRGLPDQLTARTSAFDLRAVDFSGSPPEPPLPAFPSAQSANLLDRRLDMQLNELQLDPQAFFRRLERVQERDQFVQRLAERAARRGDAAQVALNVRTVSHPLARPVVDQLLHESLIQQVSTR